MVEDKEPAPPRGMRRKTYRELWEEAELPWEESSNPFHLGPEVPLVAPSPPSTPFKAKRPSWRSEGGESSCDESVRKSSPMAPRNLGKNAEALKAAMRRSSREQTADKVGSTFSSNSSSAVPSPSPSPPPQDGRHSGERPSFTRRSFGSYLHPFHRTSLKEELQKHDEALRQQVNTAGSHRASSHDVAREVVLVRHQFAPVLVVAPPGPRAPSHEVVRSAGSALTCQPSKKDRANSRRCTEPPQHQQHQESARPHSTKRLSSSQVPERSITDPNVKYRSCHGFQDKDEMASAMRMPAALFDEPKEKRDRVVPPLSHTVRPVTPSMPSLQKRRGRTPLTIHAAA
jgi:hypothetical protein